MILSVKLNVPYAVVVLSELSKGDVPEQFDGSLVAATETCIAIGCRSDIDGPTEFVVGSLAEVDTGEPPIFAGNLKVTHKLAALHTMDEAFVTITLSKPEIYVKIWVNDQVEPEFIQIGIDNVLNVANVGQALG